MRKSVGEQEWMNLSRRSSFAILRIENKEVLCSNVKKF